jgi:hypothetical protein
LVPFVAGGITHGQDSANAAQHGDGQTDSKESSSDGYDELWCTHCLDDKGVVVCAFCGCKVTNTGALCSLLLLVLCFVDAFTATI